MIHIQYFVYCVLETIDNCCGIKEFEELKINLRTTLERVKKNEEEKNKTITSLQKENSELKQKLETLNKEYGIIDSLSLFVCLLTRSIVIILFVFQKSQRQNCRYCVQNSKKCKQELTRDKSNRQQLKNKIKSKTICHKKLHFCYFQFFHVTCHTQRLIF